MKHKKVFFIIFTAIILTLVLFGCGKSNSSMKEQVIVIPYTEDVTTVNPAFNQLEKMSLVGNLLYDPLYVYSGEIKTYLANAVEFKDNKELTIELRKGLKWHDGVEITAEDVEYTLNLILDKLEGSPLREFLLIGDKPIKIEKLDNLKVKITLPEEKADFLHNLSRIAPIPKHIYEGEEKIATSSKNKIPVGSGPFKFLEFKKDEKVVLEKFDYYYGGTPKVDKIIIKGFADDNAKEEALIAEEITLMKASPDMANKYLEDSRFQVYPFLTGRVNYILFNQNIDIMKSLDIRKAISYSLDKNKLIKAVYGEKNEFSQAKSIFLPGVDYYSDDNVKEYSNNIEEAKKLLKKSQIELKNIVIGYNIEEPIHEKYAKEAKSQIEALGIGVELKGYEGLAFVQTIFSANKDCDLYISEYTLGVNPNNYRMFFEANSYYNQMGYDNVSCDKLWQEGFKELDNEKRKKIYREIQGMIMEDAPLYLIDYETGYILAQSKVKGIENARPAPVILFEDWSRLSIKE